MGVDLTKPLHVADTPGLETVELTPAMFEVFNRYAVRMDRYHQGFRRTWTMMVNACSSGMLPPRMSQSHFIDAGIRFTQEVTMHHDYEEAYLFPFLARRMPEFRKADKHNPATAELLRQHEVIHHGLGIVAEYLQACRRGTIDFQFSMLREKLDSFGTVLWTHLDQEVKTLGAENMKRYWKLEELDSFPM